VNTHGLTTFSFSENFEEIDNISINYISVSSNDNRTTLRLNSNSQLRPASMRFIDNEEE
jgi:hypothetical protein